MLSEQEINDGVTSDGNSSDVDHCESDWNFIDRPTGNLDTCLQSLNFRKFKQILSVAEGEKKSPLCWP